MKSTNAAQFIPAAQDALRTFLTVLVGKEVSLSVDAPTAISFEEANAQDTSDITISAIGNGLQYAIMLDGGWLSVLSQAMLGEVLGLADEGADDLLRELAGQGHGSIGNALSASGIKLPDVTFAVIPSGQRLSEGALPDELLRIPFSATINDQKLGGFALIPDVEIIVASPDAASAVPSQKIDPLSAFMSDTQHSVDVSPLAFPDLGAEMLRGDGGNGNFGLLADVGLEITVELGRRKLPLAELLRLTTGSVVELEKLVGEPLEVYANGRFIGEGEAVVIDEQFGIRITSLAASKQRAKAFM